MTEYIYIVLKKENTKMADLLDAHSLTEADILSLVDEAKTLKSILETREIKKLPTLRGKTIVSAFYENSTRTRVSFETAGKRLSADVINVSVGVSSVAKGESLEDMVLTLSALGADALILRHPHSGSAAQVARWTKRAGFSPAIINAGDGLHEHPTQALLDVMTILENFDTVRGLNVTIVGDIAHSRVARSNVGILSTLGANITLVSPPTLTPTGVDMWPHVHSTHDLDSVLPSTDVLMLLRVQQERMTIDYYPSAGEYSSDYGFNNARSLLLPAHAIVLHPGPMVRDMEISYEQGASPRSRVLEQVKNGVYMRMAVLYRCIYDTTIPNLSNSAELS